LGSSGRDVIVYLVAITSRSRLSPAKAPMNRSDVPFV
jgi:hypothetical protein